MLVCAAILIALLIYFRNKFSFLGRDLFRARNKRALLRILLPLGAFIGYASSLGEGTSVEAEVYEKGFRLRIGKKSYAYAYKDISCIQRSLWSNGVDKESAVNMVLTLLTGEEVKLGVDENDTFLHFSKMLLEQHRDCRQDELLQKYGKGETLDFDSLQVNKVGMEIRGKTFARTEISELVPAGKHDNRQLSLKDSQGKVLEVISRDCMCNDYLFNVILEQEGISYR